jgi:ribose transport system ATP-binding protein
MLSHSVSSNISLGNLARFSIAGLIRFGRERQAAESLRDRMEIRCHALEQAVGTLSGGNQQKVVVARWLVGERRVYLFDEPTRGIDVAARARIYRLFDSLAEAGKSIVIVSSEVEELLETCDRVLVMSGGRLVAQFDRREFSRDAIIEASFAGYRADAGSIPNADAGGSDR